MSRLIERISLGLNGAEANGNSQNAVVSDDGRYIVFESTASNLVADDTNGVSDIFRYDTQTGNIVRVSVGDGPQGAQANAGSFNASVTSDGRYVVFDTFADNLVADDSNQLRDVYLRDIDTGITTRVSERFGIAESSGGTYGSYNASISQDVFGALMVSYTSDATNLITGDANGVQDVFLYYFDPTSSPYGTNYLVSNNNNGAPSDAYSGPYSSVSTVSGPVIAFASQALLASNAYPTDAGSPPTFPDGTAPTSSSEGFKLYISDGQNTVLVGLGAGGSTSDGHSFEVSMVFPYIAYTTSSTDIGLGVDYNSVTDVYVYNYQTQTFTLVSSDVGGYAGNGESGFLPRVAIRDDNTPVVTFSSAATNLATGDTNGQIDFFTKDLYANEIIRLSENRDGVGGNGTSTGLRPAARTCRTTPGPTYSPAARRTSWPATATASPTSTASASPTKTPRRRRLWEPPPPSSRSQRSSMPT